MRTTGITGNDVCLNKNQFYPATTKGRDQSKNEKRKEKILRKKKPGNVRDKKMTVAQYHQHMLNRGVHKSEFLPCMVLPRPCPNFQPCF